MKSFKGFTLVELAIVITIIGLLIGGVLKGQELLQNSRVTAAASQLKALTTGVVTFKDIYKFYPGDIPNPANFIQGCTTSPCNISGNGNGIIGPLNAFDNENNNLFLHMAKAGVISSIDPNSDWTSATLYAASYPSFPMGGKVNFLQYDFTPAMVSRWPDGLHGPYWYPFAPTSDNANWSSFVPVNQFAKFDLKTDDGRPWQGDAVQDTHCGTAEGATAYNPNNSTPCSYNVRGDF